MGGEGTGLSHLDSLEQASDPPHPVWRPLDTPWRPSPCPPEGSRAVAGRGPTLPFSCEETCPQDHLGLG